jgi:hypothetical protein
MYRYKPHKQTLRIHQQQNHASTTTLTWSPQTSRAQSNKPSSAAARNRLRITKSVSHCQWERACQPGTRYHGTSRSYPHITQHSACTKRQQPRTPAQPHQVPKLGCLARARASSLAGLSAHNSLWRRAQRGNCLAPLLQKLPASVGCVRQLLLLLWLLPLEGC